jgi:hypothetical protein
MTTLIPKFDLMNGGTTPLGAVNRPINQKLSEIVSIKDFGAVGDGATNDTVAIQKALDSGNSIVYFPSGNYLCGAVTISTAGQILQGAGALKTQITSNAASIIMFSVTADHVSIKDMKFQCGVLSTAPSTSDTVAIKSFNSYCLISNVITNQFALGIQISDGIRNTIEKCRVICETHSYIGISLSGGGEHTVDNNIIQASSDLFAGLALLYVYNSPANVISNNYITRGIGYGIYAYANPSAFENNVIWIVDNDIDFIYNWGIYVQGYQQVHITDNWLSAGNRWNGTAPASGANIYNNATGQIYLNNCQDFFITSNDIYQSEGEYSGTTALTPSQPSYGALLYGCSYGIVMGNISQDNSVGFSTTNTCSDIQFIANTTGQLIGLGPDGTPQNTGFQDDGSGVRNAYTSNIIYQLNTNPPQDYVGINTYTVPNINSVTSWSNNSYATFTSSKSAITSAISASGVVSGQTASFKTVANRYYQVTVFVTLTSGQLPNLGIYNGSGGGFDYGPTALVAGFNTITYKASATGSSASLIVQSTAATNFSLTCKFIEISF